MFLKLLPTFKPVSVFFPVYSVYTFFKLCFLLQTISYCSSYALKEICVVGWGRVLGNLLEELIPLLGIEACVGMFYAIGL